MLKPTTDFANADSLLLSAHEDLARAVRTFRAAQKVEQSAEERAQYLTVTRDSLEHLRSHFEAAIDCIPPE